MAFSDYGSVSSSRPDRPLVVKCTFDRSLKRITFASARNCEFELLKARVEQCFSLFASSFTITYTDDDGEVTDITSDSDLTEAIHYFQSGVDDMPLSSAASIFSGRSSSSSRKITLRVQVVVDYDGPSLSDTASIRSEDEFGRRNGSELSLSFDGASMVSPPDFDDDSVTVSSGDTGSRAPVRKIPANRTPYEHSPQHSPPSPNDLSRSPSSSPDPESPPTDEDSVAAQKPLKPLSHTNSSANLHSDPGAVFERLRMAEELQASTTALDSTLSQSDRGAQWLRDQNARTIRAMVGPAPDPSITDSESSIIEHDDILGDLALQQDLRGKYYYAYTNGSSSAASHAGVEEVQSPPDVITDEVGTSSHGLAWLASHQRIGNLNQPRSSSLPSTSSSSRPPPKTSISDPQPFSLQHVHPDIPPEVLQFVETPAPPPSELTDCSSCGVILDSFRYVCTTCGPKSPRKQSENDGSPRGKGKGKEVVYPHDHDNSSYMSYPPSQHRSPAASASSWTLLGDSGHLTTASANKPLPQLPPNQTSPSLSVPSPETGYELCTVCIESAGVFHALEGGHSPSVSPAHGNSPLSSPEEARTTGQWRRNTPRRKGHLRHAYTEKVWGIGGWKDVEQDDLCNCSICKIPLTSKRYKCVSCAKFDLCRSCYSQVHEIHPRHAFLAVPDKPVRSRSEPSFIPTVAHDPNEEPSMKHPDVQCAHCLQDIVGARFHCAICPSVDICANCESAGLPGNLTADDGGHDSSHIMIKIPYPVESGELQTASRRAIHLWTGRDAPNLLGSSGRPRSNSNGTSYAATVVGMGSGGSHDSSHQQHSSISTRDMDHRIPCRGCNHTIVGLRYQCATCPSLPTAYNLCANCEARSYLLHDPMHVFFKIPRPVDRAIESPFGFLPILYRQPCGTTADGSRPPPGSDPREYLNSLHHQAAICDLCMDTDRIRGEWFRCVYCAKDLCYDCESLDHHDLTHFFVVFKSLVDMNVLRTFANLNDPNESPPIIPYPVYNPPR